MKKLRQIHTNSTIPPIENEMHICSEFKEMWLAEFHKHNELLVQ